jgi:5'(3')-deoxyribonucleotidase
MSRVAVDIDNVSVQMTPHVLNEINRKYGTHFTEEDVDEWHKKFKHPQGGKDIDYTKELFENYDRPGWMEQAPLVPGAKEGIQELMNRGHKVFLLTGRHPKYEQASMKTAQMLHPDLKVIHAPEGKHHHVDKFDVLLEDSPKEIKNVGLAGGNTVTFDRPWNRKLSPLYGNRVHDWNEFLRTMKRF